jgi:hypothetical protein
MELADSVYNYEKYNTTLEEQLPNTRNDVLIPLNIMANNVQSVNFEGISNAFGSKSSLEGCDLPHCKAINRLDDLLKCEGPACDTLKSTASWIKNGTPPSGTCNDPLCAIAQEVDLMLKSPQDCTNPLCDFVRHITGEDFLSNILMEILNFILGPFKTPFTTILTVIMTIVLGMFLILIYLIFFK